MILALLLVVCVIVELGITVWLLARHNMYLQRIRELEVTVGHLVSGMSDLMSGTLDE